MSAWWIVAALWVGLFVGMFLGMFAESMFVISEGEDEHARRKST